MMATEDVVVDFWGAYERHRARKYGALAKHALDKCEETFARGDWSSFGFWHAI